MQKLGRSQGQYCSLLTEDDNSCLGDEGSPTNSCGRSHDAPASPAAAALSGNESQLLLPIHDTEFSIVGQSNTTVAPDADMSRTLSKCSAFSNANGKLTNVTLCKQGSNSALIGIEKPGEVSTDESSVIQLSNQGKELSIRLQTSENVSINNNISKADDGDHKTLKYSKSADCFENKENPGLGNYDSQANRNRTSSSSIEQKYCQIAKKELRVSVEKLSKLNSVETSILTSKSNGSLVGVKMDKLSDAV